MRLLNQTNSMELSFKKLFQLKHKKIGTKWKRKENKIENIKKRKGNMKKKETFTPR